MSIIDGFCRDFPLFRLERIISFRYSSAYRQLPPADNDSPSPHRSLSFLSFIVSLTTSWLLSGSCEILHVSLAVVRFAFFLQPTIWGRDKVVPEVLRTCSSGAMWFLVFALKLFRNFQFFVFPRVSKFVDGFRDSIVAGWTLQGSLASISTLWAWRRANNSRYVSFLSCGNSNLRGEAALRCSIP